VVSHVVVLTLSFQWYNESGDVDKAISVMMTALGKHSTAITAGGYFSVVVT